MRIIPREVRKITYSAEIRDLKKTLALDATQKSVVIGSILGDAHLEPNWSYTNYRLKVQHSVDQTEYVMWKYHILRDWVLTEPKEQARNHSIRFRTVSHSELTKLRNIFYRGPKREKTIPKDIALYLDPLAIAVWFMDDGNIRRRSARIRGYHLNTQSFTREDNIPLKEYLTRIGLSIGLEMNHGKTRIYINTSSIRTFQDLVSLHIVPSMRYKLG